MPEKDGLNDDGGCAVDWSWLAGEEIASVASGLDRLTFRFRSGETLEVRALLWKGKPFLSFTPHEPPRGRPVKEPLCQK
jgi:hypothetical protein